MSRGVPFSAATFSSGYDRRESHFSPFYFNASLKAFSVDGGGSTTIEMTATDHGAIVRLRFPKADAAAGWDQTRRLIVWLHNATESTLALADGSDGSVLIASTQVGNGAAPVGKDGRKLFRMWLAIKVPKPASSLLYRNETRDRVYARLDYAVDVEELLVRVGTSLISAEQAEHNLLTEVADRTFEDLTEESRMSWRDVLSRVEVPDARQIEPHAPHDSSERLRVLYSALYRSSLFPRRAFERDRLSGEPVHYSPYDTDGRVFDGVLSTDSGFWDGCAPSGHGQGGSFEHSRTHCESESSIGPLGFRAGMRAGAMDGANPAGLLRLLGTAPCTAGASGNVQVGMCKWECASGQTRPGFCTC